MMRLLVACLLSTCLPIAAEAAVSESAAAAFARGDYEDTLLIAASEGGAENLALAARTHNAIAYFDPDRKSARKEADAAYDAAREAMRFDPALSEAHLQAAIALALKGALISPARAFLSGLAGKARKEIDAALAIDPDNPWALSTSAAWRIEVARRGGAKLYGADPVKGRDEFIRALEVAPDNVAIAYECALRLLADGRPEWRAEGLSALDAALAGAPTTKFEDDIQARAREFRAAIEGGPKAERKFIEAQP